MYIDSRQMGLIVGFIYLQRLISQELFFKFIITYLFYSLIGRPIIYTISVYCSLIIFPYKLVLNNNSFLKNEIFKGITGNIEFVYPELTLTCLN